MKPGILEFVGESLDWYGRPGKAADIGALDVNGTARGEFERRRWSYLGIDMEAGKNVDLVWDIYELFGRPSGEFDCVSCLETLEHVTDPVKATRNLIHILKKGGLLILSTPANGFPEHRFPIDCWRLMPDGMKFLFTGFDRVLVEERSMAAGPTLLGRGVKL